MEYLRAETQKTHEENQEEIQKCHEDNLAEIKKIDAKPKQK